MCQELIEAHSTDPYELLCEVCVIIIPILGRKVNNLLKVTQ